MHIIELRDDSLEDIGSDGLGTGLEAESSAATEGAIQAPFDPALIDVVTQARTVDLLLARLREGEMNLSPDFQRRSNLWSENSKSGLIESMLLRIPIPSLYVSEDRHGNYTVVDGLQRMCAIAHFVDAGALNKAVHSTLDPLALKGLQSLPREFEGALFEKLPRPLQRRINETELTLHVIRAGTPPNVKFSIFSRINRGGLPLSAQEIRNAIYPGAWQIRVKSIAESNEFRQATEYKIRGERMEDIELVLRVLALNMMNGKPRPDDQNMDDFLNNFVQYDGWSEINWAMADHRFKLAMSYAPRIFGRYAFRKYYGDNRRRPINKGLFECQAFILGQYFSENQLKTLASRSDVVLEKLATEFNQNTGFVNSLLYATGRGSSSNSRNYVMHKILKGTLDA